ncbi:sensor histidine kinase [Globicatella sp. PHS-GS-PNBC-21-1553]|uniref:sensor histidine kinase n=1 Tax=Globicatella sp. PHS-GS-PNBC-21-1553 TaxID=2885764 RepID=UPI00298F118C|nr:sensor histidine kinase [Globicatella sp. PHS-GS-PNBC-21-1553]WPC08113.1 sensor histidine kinase [Globicatella sp. PHS-GS-PNBC-21-1553]
MMNFIRKHILIPNNSAIAYIYLLYMVPLLVSALPVDSISDGITLMLLIIFYALYRRGYIEQYQNDRLFLLQMLISAVITFYTGYASVFIFFAFAFNFWIINDQTRSKYFRWYYLSAIFSTVLSLWLSWEDVPNDTWEWIGIGMLFVLFSPIIAKVIAKETFRIQELSANHTRLEMIVRQSERDRIARDLHDNLGQTYSTMTIKAELAEKLMSKDMTAARKELKEIANMSRQNLNLVRQIVSDLREQTIAQAMVEVSETLNDRGIFLLSYGEEITEDWPIEQQYVISAVIKEATTNILRHSQASRAKFNFSQTKNTLNVEIHDNGIGISETNLSQATFGLQGMNQRIQEVHGKFTISNDFGTKISIEIPKGG